MAYEFTPPTVEEGPLGGGPLFGRYRLARGITVMRNNGVWSEQRFVTQEDELAADVCYRGGYKYPLTDVARADLIAAGYGAYIAIV